MRIAVAGIMLLVLVASASGAPVLINPGLDDTDYGTNLTGQAVSAWPVTVDPTNADFQLMTSGWVLQAAGDWDSAPGGTGNSSVRCWALRKGYRHIQLLARDSVASGDQLALDWAYCVLSTITVDVTFEVLIVGFNEATGAEAATTINLTNGTFGGEAYNSAVLATSTVTVTGGTADDLWHNAPQTTYTLTQDWDYVGIIFRRTAGVTNSTAQQVDSFSLTLVPEPATMGLLGLGLIGLVLRRKQR